MPNPEITYERCAEVLPEDGDLVINSWYARRLRGDVIVARNKEGKSYKALHPSNPVDTMLNTMAASAAWLYEAEANAHLKLADLIKDHLFDAYLMTGTFIEKSKRSGIIYVFRKLRPTIALKPQADESIKILCTLCLHPIGYYSNSWAGAMVPTDDVIAHLVLMRGDEADYWRQANQHSVWRPQSAL